MAEQTATLQVEIQYDDEITDKEKLSCAMDILLRGALLTPGVLITKGDISISYFLPQETIIDAVSMFQAALEAVSHVGQANWAGRETAAIEWLKRVIDGKTDKSLDDIQEEVNNR